MEHITITIDTGNAAFKDEPATELAYILQGLAARWKDGEIWVGNLRDTNGNICGYVHIDQ